MNYNRSGYDSAVLSRLLTKSVDYLKSVKETMSHTRVTQFPASNTSHVKKEKHNLTSLGGGRTHSTKVSRYQYDKKKGEINVEHRDYSPDKEVRTTKKIPANAAHEKELKNASTSSPDLHKAVEHMKILSSSPKHLEYAFQEGNVPYSTREKKTPRSIHTTLGEGKYHSKRYDYSKKKGEIRVSESGKFKDKKVIPADAEHEEELKNASIHARLDEIMQKAVENRPRSRGPGKDYISQKNKEITGEGPGFTDQIRDKKTGVVGTETHTQFGTRQSVMDKEGKITESFHRHGKPAEGGNRLGGPVVDKRRDISDIKPDSRLKPKSLHETLDEILEKGRPRASERKDPNRRKVEASDDALVVPDSKHVQTMSNPGPTEAEHYERTKGGSIENLKRLAESKSAMDRKAAAAGMKKHE